MKKIFFIFIAVLITISAAIAAVSGYRLVTSSQEVNIVEGVVLQFYDGEAWQDVNVSGGTFEFPQLNLMPGETRTVMLQARNNAESGQLNLQVEFERVAYINQAVECGTGAANYTVDDNRLNLYLPSGGQWQSINVLVFADGSSPIDTLSYTMEAGRTNALESYSQSCVAEA